MAEGRVCGHRSERERCHWATALICLAFRRRAVAVILVIHAVLLGAGAIIHSPTIDEPVHVHAGLHILREGRFDYNLGNPPLVDMIAALPILVFYPDFELLERRHIHRDAVPQHGDRLMWIFTLSRLALIPLSLLGGFCVFRWSRAMYGASAALLALILWCFSPCILTHGHFVTGDMAATALGVCASYSFWKWLRKPCLTGALHAGVLAGLALLSKMVWVILFGLWPVMWVSWLVMHCGNHTPPTRGHGVWQLLFLLLIALYVLNTGYGFERVMEPLGEYRTMLDSLPWGERVPQFLDSAPVPLPYHYVQGLVDVREVLEVLQHSYLAGEWRVGGWWYYYLYGLAVKMPVGTLGLLLLAIALSLSSRHFLGQELMMLAPCMGLLATISIATRNMSSEFRYVLPVYPFIIIYASKSGLLLFRGSHLKTTIVVTLAAWAVAASLMTFPHTMAYFNELAGGPSKGSRHQLSSSLEWGQNLWLLKRWKDRNCPEEPIWLGYWTAVHPSWLDLDSRPLPPLSNLRGNTASSEELGPQPGWYAVSIPVLHGSRAYIWQDERRTERAPPQDYAYLQNLEPVDRVAFSIHIFHVSVAEANRLRKQYGMEKLELK